MTLLNQIPVPKDPKAAARVFYDGGCPVCRREIGWYSRMRGAERIDWVDVSTSREVPSGLPKGTTIHDLMRRFTIVRSDGRTVSGGRGFIALWRALRPVRWLGLAADHAPGRWIAERIYRLILRVRQLWRPTS